AEAVVDKSERDKTQGDILHELVLIYFRVLKNSTYSPAMPAVLEGLTKFAYLINLEIMIDLMKVLKALLKEDILPLSAALQAILTGIKTLQGPGQELKVDEKDFVDHLYRLLLRFAQGENVACFNTALHCVEAVFIKRKEIVVDRVAAFIKRLLVVSMYLYPHQMLAVWQGERHLVPMLDMVNCQEGPANQPPARVHRTALSADGRVAVTRAAWAFPANSQVVENYGQPNWIYFLYHGFVLSKNSHDCAHIVLDMESPMQKIQVSDLYEVWYVAKVRHLGLTSLRPDFCLSTHAIPKQALQAAALYTELHALSDVTYIMDGSSDVDGDAKTRDVKALRLVLQKRLDALGGVEMPSSTEGINVDVLRVYMDQQHLLLTRLIDTLDTKLLEPLM
ncbi:hypothetical protein DYB26_014943, partial [Aphanomyces astaci]